MKKNNLKLILLIFYLFCSNIYSQYFPEWAQIYHSTNSTSFNISRCALDQLSNVYVSGVYYNGTDLDAVITKFSQTGQYLWQYYFAGITGENDAIPTKILISQGNFIYFFGYTDNSSNYSESAFIRKYDQNGNMLNSLIYKRTGCLNNRFMDAVLDNNSNLCLVGGFMAPGSFFDSLLVLKCDPNLNILWERAYADTLSYGNGGISVKTDTQGNIFIAGALYENPYGTNLAAFKYTSAGTLAWVRTYRYNNTSVEDAARDIILDNNQDVILTGYSRVISGNDTGLTIVVKYNNAGIQQWANTYNLSSDGFEYGEKLLYNGNIFAQVFTYSGKKLIKIGNTGNSIWNISLPENMNYGNFDNLGNIIFTGYQAGSLFNPLSLIRVTQNGTFDQNFTYTYSLSGMDIGYYFKQYPDSKIFLLGSHDYDLLFLRLQNSVSHDVTLSRNGLNKPITDFNYTYDTIIVNSSDLPVNSIVRDVNVTVDTILYPLAYHLIISISHLNFNDTLSLRRGINPNYIGTKFDDTASVNICSSNNSPFTGYYKPCFALSKFNHVEAFGAWILKIYDVSSPYSGTLKAWKLNLIYDTPPISVNPISSEIPSYFSLSQNYPNPFNPATKIRFNIPSVGAQYIEPVQLKVYDILGREVETLVNEQLEPGMYEVTLDGSNFPSGVYLYRITAGDPSSSSGQVFVETKKMILLK